MREGRGGEGEEGGTAVQHTNIAYVHRTFSKCACVCVCVCVCVCLRVHAGVCLSACVCRCVHVHLGSSLSQCHGNAPQTLPYLIHKGLRLQEVPKAHMGGSDWSERQLPVTGVSASSQ